MTGPDHVTADLERDDDDIRPFAEAGRAPRGPRRFDRNRLRLGVVVAVVAGAIAFVLLQGLGSATTYFRNADEAVADRAELGTDRFRLQGTVVEGSRRQVGETVEFEVAYDCAFVPVVHRGDPPELFREGIPVVLEGAYGSDSGRYESDRILVRHTEEYKTEESERLALARDEVCADRGRGGVLVNAALGTAGVALGLAAALLGIVTLAVGIRSRRARLLRLGRAYAWLVLAGAVVATVAMERALVTRDFSLTYVADNGSRATPALYNVATLWAALEGSIILWSLILAGFTVGVVVKFRARLADPLVAWATLVMLVVCAFFFVLMAGPANPFTVVAGAIPTDGPGPNPLLQNHPLMAIHPPMLYLGYVGFTVPFAFAVAALVTGRLGEGWLAATRRWTLLAWGFLTVGIGLGAWWSYEVLGWGGFWAWDPVENASLLPWLTGTAYLHSVMVQERRGMLRVWNLSLLLATFSLTILGTFLTRSGVLDSVHSFTESPIGVWLLCAFAATVVVTVGLIGWRGDRLRSPGSIDSPVSREGAFLLNNLLFAAFAFVVLLGTVFPLVVEAVNDDRISVGNPYFDRMTAPIGLALLFLMAVAPALPWRRTSGELLWARLRWPTWAGAVAVVVAVAVGARGVLPLAAFALAGFAGAAAIRQVVVAVGVARSQGRSPLWGFVGRSNGGMVVHLGVVVVAVAFTAASSYTTSGAFTLVEGASASIGGHTVTYEGMNPEDVTSQRTQRSARVRIDGDQVYEPALNQFPNGGQTVGTPSVQPGAVDDVYLTLIAPPEREGGPAVIGVLIEPLVSWLWVGGGIMGLGTLLSAWPNRRRGRGPAPASLASSDGAPAAGAETRATGPAAGPGVDLRPDPAPSPDAAGEPERVPTRAR